MHVNGGGGRPGRRAGPGVVKYNAQSPTQCSKIFNSIIKTIHFAHLGDVLLSDLWSGGHEDLRSVFNAFPIFKKTLTTSLFNCNPLL